MFNFWLILGYTDHFLHYLHVYFVWITWHYPVQVTWYNVKHVLEVTCVFTVQNTVTWDVTCAGQREGSLSEGFQRAFKDTGASHVIWRHGLVVGMWKCADMVGWSRGMSHVQVSGWAPYQSAIRGPSRGPCSSHVIWRQGHVVGCWWSGEMFGWSRGMSRDRSGGSRDVT